MSSPESGNTVATKAAKLRMDRLRKALGFAAKLAVTALLIAYIGSKADFAALAGRMARLSLLEIIEILGLMLLQMMLVAERWRRVSGTLGVPFGFSDAMRIFWIGAFFTQGMPSSIGGDVIRVWLVRRLGGGWTGAISSVFADRIMALITVVAITSAALPSFRQMVPDAAPFASLAAMGLACAVGVVVLIVAAHPIERLVARWRILRHLMRLALDIRKVLVTGRIIVPVALMSCGVVLLTVWIVMATASALGVNLDFWHCLILMPPIILILAVPISFAGWGLREGVMIYLFGFAGIAADDSLAISVTFGLATLLIALPGGLIWLASGLKAPPEAELASVEEDVSEDRAGGYSGKV